MEPGKPLFRAVVNAPKKTKKFPEESFFKELSNHLFFFSQKSSLDRRSGNSCPGQKKQRGGPEVIPYISGIEEEKGNKTLWCTPRHKTLTGMVSAEAQVINSPSFGRESLWMNAGADRGPI
ncbi:hypothetical protein CEXT_446051 [Caerostris extrusa]|uniref:Uncharacterized protein n=1 Tax=Caerostris extrusa TaxID=172846 RepID=A0AAV4USS2_CAEEX|nr:hypothetical protein CEXT_446051 [Caerostris extrusa]